MDELLENSLRAFLGRDFNDRSWAIVNHYVDLHIHETIYKFPTPYQVMSWEPPVYSPVDDLNALVADLLMKYNGAQPIAFHDYDGCFFDADSQKMLQIIKDLHNAGWRVVTVGHNKYEIGSIEQYLKLQLTDEQIKQRRDSEQRAREKYNDDVQRAAEALVVEQIRKQISNEEFGRILDERRRKQEELDREWSRLNPSFGCQPNSKWDE